MKDEIKEILGEITNIRDNFADGVLIDLFNKIEDYITNLQEKYDIALTDLVHESHKRIELENKITNLQEELKSANESITWWQNRFNALQEENERLKQTLNKYEIYD